MTVTNPKSDWKSPAEIIPNLPRFRMSSPERFGLAKAGSQRVILREALDRRQPPTLVGIVSKQYQLVQHEQVLESALSWIATHEKPFDTAASQQAEIGHIVRLLLN